MNQFGSRIGLAGTESGEEGRRASGSQSLAASTSDLTCLPVAVLPCCSLHRSRFFRDRQVFVVAKAFQNAEDLFQSPLRLTRVSLLSIGRV